MRKLLIVALIFGAGSLALAQTSEPQWQRGTIMAVDAHSSGPWEHSDAVKYDVTVKVRNTVYVVLFTPPGGSNTVEYRRGLDLLVQVKADSLAFNKAQDGGVTEVPILRKEVLATESTPDLSKVSGQYYTLKLQNLSQVLGLSEEQQKQIKPIIEQETAVVAQFWDNPVLTRKDKLNRWEKTVRSSDQKLKPFLSADQIQKLQEMRKEQKEQLKQLAGEQK
jgi:hypothetical protein